ncbi:MAG TPA: NAD(P)/FAD-dependent oxidoreductase [Myxococcales bacterium]|nr:NAD(P)/FAD-dependent oxidoreductase [Myxococcales bacterium]
MDAEVDVAVVGGGVVGCAVASALSRAGRSVLLLEAAQRLGDGVTSRNSGVIHSGLYYPPRSLKAQACVRGSALLYEWARARGVPHGKPGKLVVAVDPAAVPDLEALEANARESGARGVELVPAAFVREREPAVPAAAALWCPETGIVDPVELTRSLAADAAEHGALVLTQARLRGIARKGPAAYDLDTARGPVRAERVVNAAGLHADEVAALAGVERYRVHPWRGDYFRFAPAAPFRHLVYPVRRRGAAGLGVHLTLDLAGGCRLGPDVEHVARKDDLSPREDKLPAFLAAARALLGDVRAEQLAYDGCGIRPKLRGPSDPDEKDFVVSEDLPGFVNLVGIESPGLTAALALAERVAALLA